MHRLLPHVNALTLTVESARSPAEILTTLLHFRFKIKKGAGLESEARQKTTLFPGVKVPSLFMKYRN